MAAIEAVRNDYVRAINEGDATSAILLYTSAAVRMADHEPALIGSDAILESYRATMMAFTCDVSLTSEETRIAGDWAFDRGQFMLHMTPKSGGAMAVDHGKYLVILQKEGAGVWKIAREMLNSSMPAASAEPAAAPRLVAPASWSKRP
jgi:ketosteroid isomerase-like protein